jgi:hypothetical protein
LPFIRQTTATADLEAARLRGLGVRPGVPDLIAIHRGHVYAIELRGGAGS